MSTTKATVPPLTPEEIGKFSIYMNIEKYIPKEIKKKLPKPRFMIFYTIQDKRNILNSEIFADAVEAGERGRLAAIELEKKQAAEMLARRYYNFWHYRGTVYGGSKYKERSGDYLITVTEFFVQRTNKADQQIKLYGFDVPIANGQEVAVIYGAKKPQTTGYPIVFINYNTRQQLALGKDHSKLMNSRSYSSGDGVPPIQELEEYIQKYV